MKNVAKTFVEVVVGSASSAAESGGGGGGGGGETYQPLPEKLKVSSDVDERRLARLARFKASSLSKVASPGTATVKQRAITESQSRPVVFDTHCWPRGLPRDRFYELPGG